MINNNSKQSLQQGISAIITGASTGIGKALAIELAKKYRARLVLNARRADLLDDTVKEVIEAGGQALAVSGDVADKATAEKLLNTGLEAFGQIDLLVNNAGLARSGSIEELTPEDWHHVFNINFFGALYCTYAVLPHYLAKSAGKIVNISSVAGKVSFPGSVCYAASKFAMTGMSEGMAAELGPKGIDVITVCPGWVRTEFFSNNKISDKKNPTLIAEGKNLSGFVMKHLLSISAKDTADTIINACNKGGGRELILTGPGKIVERLHAICPELVFELAKKVPVIR
jgi:NAD(P)-dependent dehydrogenase (short-subunit alcohol dehydrogenase family)